MEVLRNRGIETELIGLKNARIEFCRNCRKCTQTPGSRRQPCVHGDDMEDILSQVDSADGLILVSPVNFFSVTAVMKRFIERMLVYVYWPWGKGVPVPRRKKTTKRALIITCSAAPAWLARLMLRHPKTLLKRAAALAGARVVKWVHLGTVAITEDQRLNDKQRATLRKAAYRLF